VDFLKIKKIKIEMKRIQGFKEFTQVYEAGLFSKG